MAGSFEHIVNEKGNFYMDLIENMGDAHEALEECFEIIKAHAPNIYNKAVLNAKRTQAEIDEHGW